MTISWSRRLYSLMFSTHSRSFSTSSMAVLEPVCIVSSKDPFLILLFIVHVMWRVRSSSTSFYLIHGQSFPLQTFLLTKISSCSSFLLVLLSHPELNLPAVTTHSFCPFSPYTQNMLIVFSCNSLCELVSLKTSSLWFLSAHGIIYWLKLLITHIRTDKHSERIIAEAWICFDSICLLFASIHTGAVR